ncbi:MAG: ribonuclease HI family protein [Candidatus Micrarchaeia archaeon]
MKLYVYTDGASRGNPGISASGFAVYDANHRLVNSKVVYNGIKTNNFAEYNAMLLALQEIESNMGYKNVIFAYSDSELLVRQLNRIYRTKDDNLKVMNARIRELASKFDGCIFRNLPRENVYISRVDRELNKFLDNIKNND